MKPSPFEHLRAVQNLRATMSDNPMHNQHIMEYTSCMEQAFNDNNRYNDQRFTELLDALTALDRRMTSAETAISRLEAAVYKKPEQMSQKVQADIVVTKDSLRRVRDAIMNIFR